MATNNATFTKTYNTEMTSLQVEALTRAAKVAVTYFLSLGKSVEVIVDRDIKTYSRNGLVITVLVNGILQGKAAIGSKGGIVFNDIM